MIYIVFHHSNLKTRLLAYLLDWGITFDKPLIPMIMVEMQFYRKMAKKYLLQCKRYHKTNTVGRPELQQFQGAIGYDKAEAGFFVTTGMFTSGAKEYAKELGIIILIDGNELL